jgi:hypothetical protein
MFAPFAEALIIALGFEGVTLLLHSLKTPLK